jgi:hypothetical protein
MAKTTKTEGAKDPFMEAVTVLEKRYGAGTVIFGKDVASDYEIVPTGSLNHLALNHQVNQLHVYT